MNVGQLARLLYVAEDEANVIVKHGPNVGMYGKDGDYYVVSATVDLDDDGNTLTLVVE